MSLILPNRGLLLARSKIVAPPSGLFFVGGAAANTAWSGVDGTSWSYTSGGLGAVPIPLAPAPDRFVVAIASLRFIGNGPTISASFNGVAKTTDYSPWLGNNSIRTAYFSGVVATGNDLGMVLNTTQTCIRSSVRVYATYGGATASWSSRDYDYNTGSGQTFAEATVTVPTGGAAIFSGIGTHEEGGCAASGDITEDAVGAVEVESSYFTVNGGVTNEDGSQAGSFSMSGSSVSSGILSAGVAYAP